MHGRMALRGFTLQGLALREVCAVSVDHNMLEAKAPLWSVESSSVIQSLSRRRTRDHQLRRRRHRRRRRRRRRSAGLQTAAHRT